ncbi:hypothetical protein [Saccharothrix longispora]|uniref:hypothetical protein n=1 Tax=Saccharothrix longispora TaxID=33920 RepID=UPI0028FD4E6C|nr:hypothetical protein [Saccharothrix longispora]MBY8848105.1 hypothetical protein [Saccharothrix sp. MB29]MDU0289268.1 hypothetical protein [Saccharothrix longispora]
MTRRSTTRRTLRGLLAGTVVAALVATGATWAVCAAVQATADSVRTRNAPAVLEAATARAALAEADRLAVESFNNPEHVLTGPGDRYRGRIALAGQYLAQIAEDNTAGEVVSRQLQLVEGLLVSYNAAIGQADAQLRQPGGAALGSADLWHASQLLHAPDHGILAQLDRLLEAQRDALDDRLAESGTTPWRAASWLVPSLVLLGLLVATQVFLVRRFRRLVNPLLALATAVALGVVVVPLVGQETRAQVTESTRALDLLVDRWRAHTTETGATARRELLVLLDRHCGGERDGCGDTVARVRRDLGPAAAGAPPTDERELTREAERINADLEDAADERGLIPLVPIGGSAVVLLVLLGLLGRLEEYRYRVR